jgi:hypothetical protein
VALRGERLEIASGLPFGARFSLKELPEGVSVILAEVQEGRGETSRLSPLYPAGALYPQECLDGELSLSFWSGWVGRCELALAGKAPRLCRAFNWPRFRAEAEERLEDPWRLSPESFALRASQGEWQSRGFSVPDQREVDIDLTALSPAVAGLESWCRQSPFAPPTRESGHLLKVSVDEGENLLFAGGRLLVILVKTNEIQCFLE